MLADISKLLRSSATHGVCDANPDAALLARELLHHIRDEVGTVPVFGFRHLVDFGNKTLL